MNPFEDDAPKTIDANHAVQIALGIGFTMLSGDKESREALYSDLSTTDLQRVLRWQTRFLLQHMAVLAAMQGLEINEAYSAWQHLINEKAINGEFY